MKFRQNFIGGGRGEHQRRQQRRRLHPQRSPSSLRRLVPTPSLLPPFPCPHARAAPPRTAPSMSHASQSAPRCSSTLPCPRASPSRYSANDSLRILSALLARVRRMLPGSWINGLWMCSELLTVFCREVTRDDSSLCASYPPLPNPQQTIPTPLLRASGLPSLRLTWSPASLPGAPSGRLCMSHQWPTTPSTPVGDPTLPGPSRCQGASICCRDLWLSWQSDTLRRGWRGFDPYLRRPRASRCGSGPSGPEPSGWLINQLGNPVLFAAHNKQER